MNQETWQTLRRILQYFRRDEVKTPLSFVHKVFPWFVLAIAAIIYSPLPNEYKLYFTLVVAGVLIVLLFFVGVFAWSRPKHLVYGESSHRAERRLEYGTESRSVDKATLDAEKGVTDPSRLLKGE